MSDARAAAHETARTAVEIAWAAPAEAIGLARAAREAADDGVTASLAEQAIGIARTAQGELAVAEGHLRAAVDLAGEAPPAAEARGALALVLALTGRSREALDTSRDAGSDLTGRPAATLAMRRALVLLVLGHDDETEDAHVEALRLLAAAGGDPLLEADIRNNLGMAHIQRRDWAPAAEELDRAEALYVAAGQLGNAAVVHHNRGLAAALRGDLPAALRAFDEAAERYRTAGISTALLPVERAEALLSVLLVPDARRAAEEAVETFTRQRHAAHLVNARVVLARAALLAGDLDTAAHVADRARRAAVRQGRPAWAALAGYVGLRARFAGGERTPALLRACGRVAAALGPAGWVIEAVDARLLLARTAIELDRPEVARRELTEVTRHHGVDGPAELRARIWHAHALLRLAEGDHGGAESALDAGLGVLEDFRASLGATELRVHASGHAGELALLGVRLALADDRAAAALLWAERYRAGALLLRPVVPVADEELAADLAELRQVVAGLSAAAEDGRPAGDLKQRQVRLEEAIRRRSHRAGPRHLGGPPVLRSVGDLGLPAEGTALVEYMTVDGELHAVVVRGRRAILHRLGPVAAAEPELEALRYGLRRLAYGIGSPTTLKAARDLTELRARRLDAIVLEPLREDLGYGPLVIVPTGSLHTIPWAALPTCARRPVSVTPSAALWRRAADGDRPPCGPPVFAAGPNLRHAAPEVTTLARAYPGSQRFTGRRATVEAVTRALDGAGLAHIAAHGRFRSDNPLFSSLLLSDGPLTVYDLERLERPPRHVVLSACESGLPAVHPGDELLGLASALLGMGSVSLVAAVVPVPDDASRPLMLRFHRHLRAGHSPAHALMLAQRPRPGETATERAAAAGFLCFGAG